MEILVIITSHWVTIEKTIQKYLKIAVEIGDRAGEVMAYHNIGSLFLFLEQFEEAVDNFVSTMDAFNSSRFLLKSEDNWRIKFRELQERTCTGLCRSLLGIGKVDEALFAAEQGRAQVLSDNLLIQYKPPTPLSAASIDTKETISCLFADLSTPTIFLAIEGLTINIWFLRREKKIAFRQGMLEGDKRKRSNTRLTRDSL